MSARSVRRGDWKVNIAYVRMVVPFAGQYLAAGMVVVAVVDSPVGSLVAGSPVVGSPVVGIAVEVLAASRAGLAAAVAAALRTSLS